MNHFEMLLFIANWLAIELYKRWQLAIIASNR